jgi:hypothetical protein
MYLHNPRCSQHHLRMLLQSLRALCLAPGESGSICNYLGAPVRTAGVSGKYGCNFRNDLHFAVVSDQFRRILDFRQLLPKQPGSGRNQCGNTLESRRVYWKHVGMSANKYSSFEQRLRDELAPNNIYSEDCRCRVGPSRCTQVLHCTLL